VLRKLILRLRGSLLGLPRTAETQNTDFFPSQLPIGVEWGSTAWWPEMIKNSEQHPAKQLHYSTDGDVMSSQGDAKGAP